MPRVRFGETACELQENETVLDALIRSGAPVSYSCKAGSCGSCMLRAVEGSVPAESQAGLKDSWKARGYFLPCACRPSDDVTAAPVGEDVQIAGRIASIDPLSSDVLRVRIQHQDAFEFRAGQYITLVRPDGLARSYSIASLPSEGFLELHIRCLPHGRMSEWIRAEARPGDAVRILGPSGDCFYVDTNRAQPLLLAGTGTGLAPLYGIVKDALRSGHTGPIHLIHGAVREDGLYLRDQLQQLSKDHENLHYCVSLLAADGPIDQVILSRFKDVDSWRAYLCGDPAIVQSLKKKLFLQGMDLRNIHADAFLPAA